MGARTPAEGRPRVLHVGPDPARPGGMAAVMRGLLASPLRERYAMDVLPTWRWEQSRRRHLVFPRALPRLVLWCVRPGARLVHVHTAVRGSLYRKLVVTALARAAGRPVLLHLHAGPGDIADFADRLGPLRRRVLGAAFRLADRVVSVSSAGAAAVERRFGAPAVLVVPNAAPPVAASPRPADADGPPRVLYVGGFEDPAKGGAVLVAALARLLAGDAAVRVDLAGPGAAPPALEALCAAEPRVRWLGWLDGPALDAAHRAADVVVLPSLTEGLPMVLLEAMARARVVVATRAGGMPEVLTDEEDALLADPGDAAALAAALGRAAASPELRRRLGSAARARAQRLNADALAPLERLYAQLLR